MSAFPGAFKCIPRRAAPICQATTRRQFHASLRLNTRARRRYPSIKASELEQPQFRPYTAQDKVYLAQRYTPEQMAVIEAGEAAISSEDLASSRMRTDPARIQYLDDFATMRPILDRPLEGSDGLQNLDSEADEDQEPFNHKQPPDEDDQVAVMKWLEDRDPQLLNLMQQTRLSREEINAIRVKTLVSKRVNNMTRLGRIARHYFLTIAGNQDGMVGVGEGKSAEALDARKQARMNAIRNLKPIPRYEQRTIYGDVQGKVAGTVVQLFNRPPGRNQHRSLSRAGGEANAACIGFGNRCQHLIFELGRAAGISDLAARTPRSRNKMNVVKAALQALHSQRLPEDVARGRGRKMVDARKVYYGDEVL